MRTESGGKIFRQLTHGVCEKNQGRSEEDSCKSGKVLKFLQVNCRSIKNKSIEFASLIEIHNPDKIIGTESWLSDDNEISEVFPAGFTVYTKNRGRKGG